MDVEENLFQVQTENLTQLQSYYEVYWKIKS